MLTKKKLIEALAGVDDDAPICVTDPETNTVLDGFTVRVMAAKQLRYGLAHKPYWCETTKQDPGGRTVVVID